MLPSCHSHKIPAPPQQLSAFSLPKLKESIIQVPVTLKTSTLRQAFFDELPKPLLKGSTKEFKMKLSGKEKKKEDRNFIGKLTAPLLKWVDKTFYVSSQLLYEVILNDYDLWFEKDKFFADITLDIGTKLKLKNGLAVFGENFRLDGALNCPVQVHLLIQGNIMISEQASVLLTLDDENSEIKFKKICSSLTIKELDLPDLLRPVLEPLKIKITQSFNQIIISQLQKLLDNNNENFNFKNKIDQITNQLAQPTLLMPQIWLLPQISGVFVSPPFGSGKGIDNQIELSVGLKARPLVLLSDKKPLVKIPDKIRFSVARYKPGTQLYITGKVPLDIAASKIQSFLKQYVNNHYKKYAYTTGKVSIYSSGPFAVVSVDILKSISLKKIATVYLSGIPAYNSDSKVIFLDKLNFTTKSKDLKIHIAKWLKKPQILEQLIINTRFPVSDELIKIEDELNDFKINHESGILTGKFDKPDILKVLITETDFELYLQIKGNLTFDIK
jgi:hypothetical protein